MFLLEQKNPQRIKLQWIKSMEQTKEKHPMDTLQRQINKGNVGNALFRKNFVHLSVTKIKAFYF